MFSEKSKPETAAQALRMYRAKHDMTMREFAEMVGSSAATISKYEGRKVSPSIDAALEIERVTGIPVAEWAYNRSVDAA